MQKSVLKQAMTCAVAAGIVGVLTIASVTPGNAQRASEAGQAGFFAFAFVPGAGMRTTIVPPGSCWISKSQVQNYGYAGSCANPLAHSPQLDPTFDPQD